MKEQKNKKSGFIVSAELLLITAILVIGLIVGLAPVRDAVVAELVDTATAIDSINQSYDFDSITATGTTSGTVASISGSVYADIIDDTLVTTALASPTTVTDPAAL